MGLKTNREISQIKQTAAAFIITCCIFENTHAQYGIQLGHEASAVIGISRNQRDMDRSSAAYAGLGFSAQIPIVEKRWYLAPEIGTELHSRAQDFQVQNAYLLQSKAIYFTPGIRSEYLFYPLGKRYYFGFGVGFGYRLKTLETNTWQDKPNGGFPRIWSNTVQLYPFFLRYYDHSHKYGWFFELSTNIENRKVASKVYVRTYNSLQIKVGFALRPEIKKHTENHYPGIRTLSGPAKAD